MLFVFNKYGTCKEEHLKSKDTSFFSTFKNHLLRTAYGEGAGISSESLPEDLFDNDKELEDDRRRES